MMFSALTFDKNREADKLDVEVLSQIKKLLKALSTARSCLDFG
jgi:hypothetical protein